MQRYLDRIEAIDSFMAYVNSSCQIYPESVFPGTVVKRNHGLVVRVQVQAGKDNDNKPAASTDANFLGDENWPTNFGKQLAAFHKASKQFAIEQPRMYEKLASVEDDDLFTYSQHKDLFPTCEKSPETYGVVNTWIEMTKLNVNPDTHKMTILPIEGVRITKGWFAMDLAYQVIGFVHHHNEDDKPKLHLIR